MMLQRIYLRPVATTDAPVLLKWGQDDYYHQSAGFPTYDSLIQAKQAAAQYAQRQYSYAVCLVKTGQIIGLAELYERGTNERDLLTTKEVGFLLDQEFSGRGYMTEALTMLFNFAFNQLDQTAIWAGTFASNVKSQRLLKRLGFHYQYEVDLQAITSLFAYNEKYYLLEKADWLAIQPHEQKRQD